MWTLAFGQHEERVPTHGYEPTREAAMTAFAKSCQRSDRCVRQAGWRLPVRIIQVLPKDLRALSQNPAQGHKAE
jgi:hypothetical protein